MPFVRPEPLIQMVIVDIQLSQATGMLKKSKRVISKSNGPEF